MYRTTAMTTDVAKFITLIFTAITNRSNYYYLLNRFYYFYKEIRVYTFAHFSVYENLIKFKIKQISISMHLILMNSLVQTTEEPN